MSIHIAITRRVRPAIRPWPFILNSAVFNACMVGLLTWLVMPVITGVLHGWLHSDERKTSV